jgi:hypothetical protein
MIDKTNGGEVITKKQNKFLKAIEHLEKANELVKIETFLCCNMTHSQLLLCYNVIGDQKKCNQMNMKFFEVRQKIEESNKLKIYEVAGSSFTAY